MRVNYWLETGDWPMEGGIQNQAPKVKMLAEVIVNARVAFNRRQAIRHEMICRALGGSGG